jgi:hypothetical protein
MGMVQTSLRATLAMRSQAADSAVADGAAQVAINKLRQGTFLGVGDCFEADGSALDLSSPGFYSGGAGSSATARVECEHDFTNTDLAPINEENRPGAALLTLENSGGTGINIGIQGGGNDKEVRVGGGVYSNSKIDIDHGKLYADWVYAKVGPCDGDIISADERCGASAPAAPGVDPGYAVPTGSTTDVTSSIPSCTALNTMTPGLYKGATALSKLNALTSNNACANRIYWFPAGVYYFDFDGTWLVDQGTLIGGRRAANPPTSTAMPGSCPSPLTTTSSPGIDEGVTFVFGGRSQMKFKEGANVEICGTYSETTAPLAIYGLKDSIPPGSSTPIVRAHASCITDPSNCLAFSSDPDNNGYQVYVQGTTYLPRAAMHINLKKDDVQVVSFRGGVTAYSFALDGPGNTAAPIIAAELPSFSPPTVQSRTVVWLTVYVCPNGGACVASPDKLRLRVKASIVDAGGVPQANKRQINVLSWSVQR